MLARRYRLHMAAHARRNPEEIKTAVVADVDSFRGNERQDHDVTIVVVHIA